MSAFMEVLTLVSSFFLSCAFYFDSHVFFDSCNCKFTVASASVTSPLGLGHLGNIKPLVVSRSSLLFVFANGTSS